MTHFMGLNPWLSMWSQPRTTIRAIVYSAPSYGTFRLSAIYALQALFFFANWTSLGLTHSFQTILLSSLVLAPFFGLFWLYSFGTAFYLAGRLLGGQATFSYVQSAMAWSHIPASIDLALWFVLLLNQSETTFVLKIGQTETLFVIFISCVVAVWVTVLIIRSFAEIQGFTICRAFFNLIIGIVIYFVLYFVFYYFYIYLFVK